MIYMDYNATTPCDKRVVEEMLPYLSDEYGNPSSLYKKARTARKAVDEARERLAKLLGCQANEVFFTSGGTEADNWAIQGTACALKDKGRHIITSLIEHHAVLCACKALEKKGYKVTYLPVDSYGMVDVGELKKSIRQDTILVTIMYANNEIGTIQPISEIAEITKSRGVYFHTDAVQVAGKIPLTVNSPGIDMLSLSGHKFYAPKGIGALYIRKGVKISPLLYGGEQERGGRAGTENVAGIVGIGKAAELAQEEMREESVRVGLLRDRLEEEIKKRIPQIVVNGHPEQRLYNTLNLCIKYIEGESILLNLDFEDICVSSGSACASGSLEPSHVLLAIGLPDETARGSLRFSLGKYNTEEDVTRVVTVLAGVVERLWRISPFWEKDKEQVNGLYRKSLRILQKSQKYGKNYSC
ncbi:cysteine desulfurase NifS [Candidatus Aerophobetes bacterium]|nr:cysteine desulfurase NifS [Candidatus Aerophobetes bacterium]